MKLLLDTHAVLWWLSGDERFGETAARHLTDETNQVLLSAAADLGFRPPQIIRRKHP